MQRVLAICVLLCILAQSKPADCKYNLMKIVDFYERKLEAPKFSWENCGPSTDTFKVTSLSVQPDPLPLPGVITINIAASLQVNITGPLTLALKIIKIVGPVKLEIPCIDNFGSCTYSDLCVLLPQKNSDCPDLFKQNNVPCSCPFASGDYSAQNLQLEIDLPERLPGGKYIIVGNFQTPQYGHVGCLNIDLNVN